MSRLYFIQDEHGTHRLENQAMPLVVGNTEEATIKLADVPEGLIVAYIAEADGHPYIQPAQTQQAIFHNHRHISESSWLKSGDWIQVGNSTLHWQVKGDQVFIHVGTVDEQAVPLPQPSQTVPPTSPAPTIAAEPVLTTAPVAEVTSQQRFLRRVVAGTMIGLALVALLVLFVTPVTIRFVPEQAEYSINGFPPAIPFVGRLMLLPGDYSVQAQYPGYRDFTQVFTVNADELQEFSFVMQELPGQLSLQLDPEVPYKLYVDGVLTKLSTQGVAGLERGQRSLRIETERYVTIERDIDIEGLGQAQQLSMTLQPAWAKVYIDSQPQGAEVRVNDRLLGTTPLHTDIVQGQRRINLRLPKYKLLSVEQVIIAGTDLQLKDLELIPADGKLVLTSQPGDATITVDGEFYATTPTTLILASNKTHNIKLTKPGYKTIRKSYTLAPESTETITLTMAPEYGTVFVRSQPADARLTVDGKDKGNATQRLRLTTRNHTLSIQKPGFTAQTISITPRAGVSQTLSIALKTLAQTKQQTTPIRLTTKAGQTLRLLRPQAPFKMGASRREAGRRANESRRLVQLTRAFYLGVKEVTNAEFRQFQPQHSSGAAEGARLNGDSQPVVNISWDTAARYCNWLSKKEGLPAAYQQQKAGMAVVRPLTTGYRLPTEVEWAYVARIHEQTTPTRYPWSGPYPPKAVVGNFADAQISNTLTDTVPGYDDGYRGSAPVGSFTARPTEFYDLGGNVAEWTNDYYSVYPGNGDKLVKDPIGPAIGEHHVVRDSSWRQGNITELRLSYRDYSRVARSDLGFRIARYAE